MRFEWYACVVCVCVCVWGGGVTPQALLTAMQEEKAVLVNKSVDEVSVCVCVCLGLGGGGGGGAGQPPGSADRHAAGEICLGLTRVMMRFECGMHV